MREFPRYVDLEFSARCNLSCGFCFGPPDDRSVQDLDPAFWEDSIAALWRRGCEGIVVSGGEPTLYRHLSRLLQSAKALGMQTVLSTHGRHEERVLVAARWCDWIALPVDGYTLESVQTLRGDCWGLQRALALADRLKAACSGQLRLKLGSVATSSNADELVQLASVMQQLPQLPFDTWKIYQYTPRRKFVAERVRYQLSDRDYNELVRRIQSSGICAKLHTVFSSNASRRQTYLFVYPDGTVAVPNRGADFSDLVLGNLATEGEVVLDRAAELNLVLNVSNFEYTYGCG